MDLNEFSPQNKKESPSPKEQIDIVIKPTPPIDDYQEGEKNISGINSQTGILVMEPKMDLKPTSDSYEVEENTRFVVVKDMINKGHRTSQE